MVKLKSTNNLDCRLAFVIPAYKGRFLADTLTSLAEQINQNFCVYIGDDASPDNLKQIIDPYRDKLDLYYQRFNENLGKNSLVKHWERCVALSSEPFFCLFADDDVLDRNCVSAFYAALNESNEKFDVYRFENAVINERGELIAYTTAPTRPESHTEFLYARLQHKRFSCMSSYVIHRGAYLREKGFVEFPLAWFSDDASIILFSRLSGIYNIAGQPVYWRLSGENISAPNQKTYLKKIFATIKYVKWVVDRFGHDTIGLESLDSEEHKKLIERWFFRHLDYAGCYPLGITTLLSISIAISPYCRSNAATLFLNLRGHVRRTNRLRQSVGSKNKTTP